MHGIEHSVCFGNLGRSIFLMEHSKSMYGLIGLLLAPACALTIAAARLGAQGSGPINPLTLTSSLKTVPTPAPSNLGAYVRDQAALVALGKALFWDQQVGSDGQSCGNCHFHAGADN